MRWLGPIDKQVFRMLTCVGGGVLVTSNRTAELMPKQLEGRRIEVVSRTTGKTLSNAAAVWPNAWLVGGQSLALSALNDDLLSEVHLCHSDRHAFPQPGHGQRDVLTQWLAAEGHNDWHLATYTRLLDVKVECWRRLL